MVLYDNDDKTQDSTSISLQVPFLFGSIGTFLLLTRNHYTHEYMIILRYTEECDLFLRRVALVCAPTPQNALDLLHDTDSLADLDTKGNTASITTATATTKAMTTTTTTTTSPSSDFCVSETIGSHPFDRLRYLPTGLESLDAALRGGIRVGTITEICGRAGAGKTQLAMQLCIMAAKHCQGSIYIDTEKKLSLPRLQEIADSCVALGNINPSRFTETDNTNTSNANSHQFSYNHHGSFASASTVANEQNLSSSSSTRPPLSSSSFSHHIPYRRSKEVLDNVMVLSPSTTPELLTALVEVEELVLMRNDEATEQRITENQGTALPTSSGRFPVRLLIVDSIAAPTKRGFGNQTVPERAAAVFQCAQRLKQLAHQLRLAVLVINQVVLEQPAPVFVSGECEHSSRTQRTSTPLTASQSSPPLPAVDKVYVKAALGTSWHHCISTRIVVEQQQQENFDPNKDNQNNSDNRFPVSSNNNLSISNRPTIKRTATIVKSNVVGLKSTSFQIVKAGVVDAIAVPDDAGR